MDNEKLFELSVTTQGPTYPPSEVMDAQGNFIVIGRVNRRASDGALRSDWSSAVVSASSAVPAFGENLPYDIVRELDETLTPADEAIVLHTLPLPLPCNNYPMVFAPQQCPDAGSLTRPSYPLHEVPIPDLRPEDGPKRKGPITLGAWCRARGELAVSIAQDRRSAAFDFAFSGLIPDSLYTVMSLRQRDLDPSGPTRPGPLGVPNVFVTDGYGDGRYQAVLPNPFPAAGTPGANRIVNVVVLWMSYQMNRGGAIGWFGLGGDIHAQLKLRAGSFGEFVTLP
ncbi:hypothetical protein [Sphaerotilus uruguayifluvii]|uniref:Uncharacterized protein n=1 Tax=Sphaerotilus uruguayifluvii TaxID=2735897 RepID=A0ABX2G7S2_9BURK|nr:hypothetical protein [Leptothrix sp. C29]NRT58376.1 hypothetical protein [Leptothrix sp. C29]